MSVVSDGQLSEEALAERRTALVNAVTAYPRFYLSAKHQTQSNAEFAAEIRQELRDAAADKDTEIVYVAIVYRSRQPVQGALVLRSAPEHPDA